MRMAAVTGLVCVLLFRAAGYAEGPTLLPGSAAACERLARSISLPSTTVELAQVIPAGTFMPPSGGVTVARGVTSLPAFCRVALRIAPSSDSDIRSEIWLPVSRWNGKFLQVGNGAWG